MIVEEIILSRIILSRNNSAEERAENVFPSVTVHRLQNVKNVTIGVLNVNSLRNKIGAVQGLTTNNIDICLLSQTKIDERFPKQQFNIIIKLFVGTEINMVEDYYFTSMKTFHASS